MPRARSQSRTALVDSALAAFWKTGYHIVSMGDLVRETGVSRGGIYSDFTNKQDLFLACLDRYQETVVTPVFAPVEAPDAGLDAIRLYLETLVSRFEASDEPGIGCLVANTLAQIEPEDTQIRARLDTHSRRLTAGFRTVFSRENQASGTLSNADIDDLADFTMISVQGLWSYSRATTDAKLLRQYAETLMSLLVARVHGGTM